MEPSVAKEVIILPVVRNSNFLDFVELRLRFQSTYKLCNRLFSFQYCFLVDFKFGNNRQVVTRPGPTSGVFSLHLIERILWH